MHCSVSAGPATVRPGLSGRGPLICGSRIPKRCASSLLSVAEPIFASASTRARGGRLMSLISIPVFNPLSFSVALARVWRSTFPWASLAAYLMIIKSIDRVGAEFVRSIPTPKPGSLPSLMRPPELSSGLSISRP